jgi:quercetin dioxygenase-like cupin family protein/ketosteroid isomerase-like protein
MPSRALRCRHSLLIAALIAAPSSLWAHAGSTVVDEVLAIDDRRTEALRRGDPTPLQEIYADDYTLVTPAGLVRSKADQIAEIASGRLTYPQIEVVERTARAYGDVVVILSRDKYDIVLDGRQMGGDLRFTRIYRKLGTRWRLIATHGSPVVGPPLGAAGAPAPVQCAEDSPERRGGEGCTILASRPLVGPLSAPVYWHLDRFESLEAAKKAAGPDGVAAEAHGSVWLMTVEPEAGDHHGGRHVAAIGPLPVPAAVRSWMRVASSRLTPGTATAVHTHPGPEVFYVVEGEQCLETPEIGRRLVAGKSYVLPGGVTHRGRVTGPGTRLALALNLHDAAHPTSHVLKTQPVLASCP